MTLRYIDETEVSAAVERLEVNLRSTQERRDVVGLQSRLMLAMLRPAYLAVIRAINEGEPPDHLRKALAGTLSNLITSLAETIAGTEPDAREAQVRRIMFELVYCLGRNAATSADRAGVEFVPMRKMGRA
jgi:hypothetical protein